MSKAKLRTTDAAGRVRSSEGLPGREATGPASRPQPVARANAPAWPAVRAGLQRWNANRKAKREAARLKKAEDDLMWDYWIAKDAYERGELTFEQFFYDERFFPGWKEEIEKNKREQNNPNERDQLTPGVGKHCTN